MANKEKLPQHALQNAIDGQLERLDNTIANPPFSLNPWGPEGSAPDPYGRSRYGVPPATKRDFAFVEHLSRR